MRKDHHPTYPHSSQNCFLKKIQINPVPARYVEKSVRVLQCNIKITGFGIKMGVSVLELSPDQTLEKRIFSVPLIKIGFTKFERT